MLTREEKKRLADISNGLYHNTVQLKRHKQEGITPQYKEFKKGKRNG